MTVGPARTVETALRLIDTAEMDGAILDRSIGHNDSYAVADALVARSVPIAFATGYGAQDLAERFSDVPILTKPCNFSDVEKLIARLGRARS